jgi:hypothetical protein
MSRLRTMRIPRSPMGIRKYLPLCEMKFPSTLHPLLELVAKWGQSGAMPPLDTNHTMLDK